MTNTDNYIDRMIYSIRNNNTKIVIWGGEQLGHKVKAFLEDSGVKYDAIAVNEEYLSDGDGFVCLEDYVRHNICTLIVAFTGYKDEMLDKLNKDNIACVYAYDFQGRFAMGADSKLTENMLKEHDSELKVLYDNLADKESVRALDTYIHQKIYAEYAKEYSHNRQYFDKDIIKLGKNECIVDCGGFDGADTREFLRLTRCNARAYVFEPDIDNFQSISSEFADDERVTVYNAAVSDEGGYVSFMSGEGSSSKISNEGDVCVDVKKIDDVIGDVKVTLLKMDIEGYELKALHGAENIILRDRPKLAVCIYHRAEDLWTIPQYILSLHSDYRLYVRSYYSAGTETVLYAL